MDFLDLIKPRGDYYFTGYYYDHIPKNAEDGREVFNYKQIDPYSRTFAMVMNTVQTDEKITAIKTRDNLNWQTKGYISTQNGEMWIIDQIIVDEQIHGYEQAVRLMRTPAVTEYLLRLVWVKNPWGVGKP